MRDVTFKANRYPLRNLVVKLTIQATIKYLLLESLKAAGTSWGTFWIAEDHFGTKFMIFFKLKKIVAKHAH